MTIAYYMDHQIPIAITRGLKSRGVDVVTANADGASETADSGILQRATEMGRAVFTMDDDFLEVASQWQAAGREFAGIVYTRQLGIDVGQAIRDLELIATAFEPADIVNRVEVIPY